jgi:hypothetical protein
LLLQLIPTYGCPASSSVRTFSDVGTYVQIGCDPAGRIDQSANPRFSLLKICSRVANLLWKGDLGTS